MRQLLAFIVLLFSVTTFAQTKKQPKKIALVVAIGDYADFMNWKHIASINDLGYIKTGLTKFGFANNIDILKNEKATKKEIIKALDRLTAKADTGDIVVFYFCGHGQQVMDDDSDEIDGYDEALVPYDAKGKFNPIPFEDGGYHGENHLRDDILGQKLAAISNKIGANGNLLVMLDACHSGSATRATQFTVCRGGAEPLKSPEYKPINKINFTDSRKKNFGFADEKGNSNMVVISASGPNQLNHQSVDDKNKPVGSLSYAFAKSLQELNPGDNYQLLFEKIKARIQADHPDQFPIMEGNGAVEIFSSRFTKPEEIISITQPNWVNDTTFYFNKGYLDDIGAGSTFTLSLQGKTEIIAGGKVARSEAFQSFGVVKKGLDKRKGYRLKLDAVNYGNFSASVFINTRNSKTARVKLLETQLKDSVKAYPFLSVGNNADFMIDIAGGDTVTLVDKTDSTRWQKKLNNDELLSAADMQTVLRKIKTAMRINYIRNIKDGGSLAKGVDVKIICPANKVDSNSGELQLTNNDTFSFQLTNNSGKDLYFTIIDITPDNDIQVLLPRNQQGRKAADCQVRNGSGPYTTELLKVSPKTPRGKEFFKFIFSEGEIDIAGVIKNLQLQRSVTNQSVEKVFGDMFNEANDKSSTKRNVSNLEIDKVGIVTVGYTVIN
jgi:metacaspase-1